MHKILQTHLLRAFVAKLKLDAIYAIDPFFATKILPCRKFSLFLTLLLMTTGSSFG